MRKPKKSESGQVLILLAVGIVTLLGFTALAIDGGRLYGERRNIQGVADTASLTGALYIAQYEGAITSDVLNEARNSALSRALSNGYDSSLVTVNITQNGSYFYVETVINSTLDPVIAQIVYNGPLKVGANSVAKVMQVTDIAHGNALFAINNSQKNAMEFSGSGNISVSGSGIFSNSGHGTNSMTFSGNSISIFTDGISASGGIYVNKPENIKNPDPPGGQFTNYTAGVPHLEVPPFPTPDCSTVPAGVRTDEGSKVTFTAGFYNGITENGHTTYEFADGFYCIDGAFTTANGEFIGENVTFYVTNGNVSLGGNVDFSAPLNGSAIDSADNNWNGMLLYIADGRLTINGNADSDYSGTVYVPTPANPSCKLNGSSDSDGFSMQLVCDSINVNGDGDLMINFDQSNLYVPPTYINLEQ